jgi:hypothetical protein
VPRFEGAAMATRRSVLTAACAGALASCATPPSWAISSRGGLIDAHCHLFNVKDLSAVRFIAYTILHQYPEAARQFALQAGFTGPDDPTFLDRIIGVALALVGARRAPSARRELAFLTRQTAELALIGDEDEAPIPLEQERDSVIETATRLLGGDGLVGDAEAEAVMRELIVQSGGGPVGLEPSLLFALPEEERRAIARRALALDDRDQVVDETSTEAGLVGRPFYFPGLIDFVVQLKRYRHKLVDELADRHAREGNVPALLAPAMVDFGRWLVEDPQPTSDLAAQVAVWREISRRREGPAVHGYVGFCPLREVLHRRASDLAESPLQLVQRALDTHGFLGVKLYPPMGFSATGNGERTAQDPPFSREVLELVFGTVPQNQVAARSRELGTALDEALGDLYALCEAPLRRAPIIAHGGNSVGAGPRTGELADPFYWSGVFDRPNGPAVMLAHFGGFSYRTADPRSPAPTSPVWPGVPYEHTWEAWLGRYIKTNPCKPVFADLSMLTEVLPGGALGRTRAGFQRLVKEAPDIVDHLVFGTDWTMLAQAKGANRYDAKVIDFLRSIFRTDADTDGEGAIEKILRGNFLRYAGLRQDSAAYDRLQAVYGGDRRLEDRLRSACLPVSPATITSCPTGDLT